MPKDTEALYGTTDTIESIDLYCTIIYSTIQELLQELQR